MAIINPEPAALSADDLSLFYTTDELLSNSPVLIFYGPTATSTQATHSRIQAHIFTPAGLQNFARLIISPTAAFYNAVTCLPREEQGDEICRGLAFSLYKYFVELPLDVKDGWEKRYSTLGHLPSAPQLFSESHAAILAAKMVKVENIEDVIIDVRHALGEQTLSWLDLDVVLPQASIKKVDSRESGLFDDSEDDLLQQRFGQYAPVLKLFGETAFLPTSKLRRAPSKPTALNRSQTFSRKQKETLRREMCELLDTEENYVSKLHDLVNNVAVQFREKARNRSSSSSSPNEQTLQGLFPPSLDSILETNSKFLDVMRVILEETENGAIQDIEEATDDVFVAPLRGTKDPPDVTGALAVAKALVEWLPQFGDCYTDYMAAHGDFSQLLKTFTKDTASSFSKRVYDTGEQRLMSLLIEPVQRLPRYNLYIDNILKQLPARHPAIKVFLKARDIVSEICSREGPMAQQVRVFDRLRKMVSAWPQAFNPRGRLITAVDIVELSPPYHGDLSGPATVSGILVLFTDSLVFFRKPDISTITARSLLADMNNPKFAESFDGTVELAFHQHLKLCDVFPSEHSEGNILQLLSPVPSNSQTGRPRSRDVQSIGIRMFYLQGAYEGKAQRFVEELTKARLEGRFPEAEREGHKWEVRSLPGDLSFFSSISEEPGTQEIEGRKEPAKVQVLVETANFAQPVVVGHQGIEVTIAISILDDGFFLLETNGLNGYTARDKLTSIEFLPVLTKRLTNYFQLRNNIKNTMLSEAYLLRNYQILKSLNIRLNHVEDAQYSKNRPNSPVKMLSGFFGGSIGREGGARSRLQRSAHTLQDIPRMAPPLQLATARPHSHDGELSRPTSSNKSVNFGSNLSPTDSLAKLEESLSNLTLALHARKGNIVGRSVRARSIADELAVNELYNSLLENPSNLELASQSSVDVLFATFEKFLSVVWKERMGPVLSHATFVSLQMRSDSMPPEEFEDFFRGTFLELAPHNQRALRAIVGLLAELLDGTSNDGDRGVLTAAFAEMLVPAGNANDFISLMDRLVQDIDILFPAETTGFTTPNYGSIDSKSRHMAHGSISSNTSLRKRLGFNTITRENSKSEKVDNESKVGSLWRSLSKNAYGVDIPPPSVSKAGYASFGRSNSIDTGHVSPKRPSSRDRPTVLGAFSFDNANTPPSRPLMGALGTIGEVLPTTGPPRKKRRSSLGDLRVLHNADGAPSWSSQATSRPDSAMQNNRQTSTSPPQTPSRGGPSHLKQSSIPAPTRLGSPFRKENAPASAPAPATTRERANSLRPKSVAARYEINDEVTIKSNTPKKKRTESITNIPILRPTSALGLSERPGSGNAVKIPPSTPRSPTKAGTPSTISPRKLRMQSPQKLRERLQIQQLDIESASLELQSELSVIGRELDGKDDPHLGTQSPIPSSTSGSVKALEARISSLEKQVKATLDTLSTRTSAIAQDISSSLQVSEARAKHLDQLYRDMNAENEALYARFNEELEKVTTSARKGRVSEEVDRRLKASEEEAARLRKENARLRREVAGLKAQIRE